VPERVAAEGVAAQQGNVREKNQRAHADAEAAIEPESLPDVMGEEDQENQGEI